MQLSTFSNPYSSAPRPKKKKWIQIQEEIELRERPEYEISPWWKIITVFSYFLVVNGGIMTSIAVGDLLAAFRNNCVFYARITLRGLDEIKATGENLTLYEDNIVEMHYGNLSDCTFAEFYSVASAVFGGIWGILFLQCGRGGATNRSSSQSWVIVPPALIVDIVFFIISCIIFGKTTGGLSYFCLHLRTETYSSEPSNITTCKEILSFQFPGDLYNTNLYLNYIIAQTGSFLTFFGWLIALFVLILRCFIPVDFVVYGRRLYEHETEEKTAEQKRKAFAKTNDSNSAKDEDFPSTTTSVEILGGENTNIATTSFCIPSTSKAMSSLNNSKKVS